MKKGSADWYDEMARQIKINMLPIRIELFNRNGRSLSKAIERVSVLTKSAGFSIAEVAETLKVLNKIM